MDVERYRNPDGFEISSHQYKLGERKGKTYKTSGSDNTGKCSYTYNELGFRGDSIFKEGFKVMSIGCSNTEGVGVNNTDTWPYQFTNLIPNGVNMNFGTGGRSNDFISRCLLTYYDLIKPDLVLIMYTSPQRRDIYTKDGRIEPFMPTTSWGYLKETDDGMKAQEFLTYLQNDNEDTINWYKNHLLIKYFLESKKCNWIWDNSFVDNDYQDENLIDKGYTNGFNIFKDGPERYLLDRGTDAQHPGKLHQEFYGHELIKPQHSTSKHNPSNAHSNIPIENHS
jgi:hypothetical protein